MIRTLHNTAQGEQKGGGVCDAALDVCLIRAPLRHDRSHFRSSRASPSPTCTIQFSDQGGSAIGGVERTRDVWVIRSRKLGSARLIQPSICPATLREVQMAQQSHRFPRVRQRDSAGGALLNYYLRTYLRPVDRKAKTFKVGRSGPARPGEPTHLVIPHLFVERSITSDLCSAGARRARCEEPDTGLLFQESDISVQRLLRGVLPRASICGLSLPADVAKPRPGQVRRKKMPESNRRTAPRGGVVPQGT